MAIRFRKKAEIVRCTECGTKTEVHEAISYNTWSGFCPNCHWEMAVLPRGIEHARTHDGWLSSSLKRFNINL